MKNKLIVALIGLVLIMSLLNVCYVVSTYKNQKNEVPVTIVQKEVVINNVTYDAPKFIPNKEEFENEAIENEALRLSNLEITSRDFKKAVFDALVCFGVDIESYKDIKELKVIESEVNENEVTYNVKVYYFIDGDIEQTETARLNEFTIEVEDLDYEDNFVDAEVNSDYLDTISVYKVYN
jgi:hypothetical protein